MNHVLLLLFIVLVSYCSCSNEYKSEEETKSNHQTVENRASLSGLPDDILLKIREYTDDMDPLRNVNQSLRYKLTLKKDVEHIFRIGGLENVGVHEPELKYVLKLTWTKNDPFLFFAALMEKIGIRRKPCKIIFRPLVSHLVKMFREFDAQTRQEYQEYLERKHSVSFERLLAKRCVETGHYDLLFDLLGDKDALRDFVSEFKDRQLVFELFRNNRRYALQYLDALLNNENVKNQKYLEDQSFRWIAECVINDLPEEYYEGLFAPNSQSRELYLEKYMFLSANVPECEYQRIHAQISKLFDNYERKNETSASFDLLRIINDIRYGSFDLKEFQEFLVLKEIDIRSIAINLNSNIAQVSLLANKKDLFDWILSKSNLSISSIFGGIQDLNADSLQAKNFKFIFEMKWDDPAVVNYPLINFVRIFYTIKRMQLDRDRIVTLDFEVVENLLEFEFPPVIQIKSGTSLAGDFIIDSFRYIKVYNESFFASSLPAMINFIETADLIRVYHASYEFIESISKSRDLLELLIDKRFQFDIRADIDFYEKYFNLPNFDLTRRIIEFNVPNFLTIIPKLNNKDHLQKLLAIFPRNIRFFPSFFLNNETKLMANENPQLVYLEWHLIFDHWIKGPDGRSIKYIRTPQIIEMLRLEFPRETDEFIKP